MFFAHAIAIASGIGHHVDLYVPENGVISLNIPLSIMRLGSLSTRTTHPYFMGMLQSLLSKLDINVSLVNPFQMQTKGEMMRTCKDLDFLMPIIRIHYLVRIQIKVAGLEKQWDIVGSVYLVL